MTVSTESPSNDLKCDNYLECHELVLDQGTLLLTESRARARGWHLWEGHVLGPQCVGGRYRLPAAPRVLPGQEPMF